MTDDSYGDNTSTNDSNMLHNNIVSSNKEENRKMGLLTGIYRFAIMGCTRMVLQRMGVFSIKSNLFLPLF